MNWQECEAQLEKIIKNHENEESIVFGIKCDIAAWINEKFGLESESKKGL